MNNYQKCEKMIRNSKFSVKGVKTFRGMEGYGINANLYYENKKIAFLLDSGNGGCMDIDWVWGKTKDGDPYELEIVKECKLYIKTLLHTFPKCKWEEMGGKYDLEGDYTWDDESIFNLLVNDSIRNKEYNGWLKKVMVFHTEKKVVQSYKQKVCDLDTKFNFGSCGVMTLREYIKSQGWILLNELSTTESYEYFDKYCG